MTEPKQLRGWSWMKKHNPDRQRQLASKGGHAMPNECRSFTKSPELAQAAGRKGGLARKKVDPVEIELEQSVGMEALR